MSISFVYIVNKYDVLLSPLVYAIMFYEVMTMIDRMALNKLISSLKEGDMDVFDSFYDATKQQMYYTIISIIKDQSLAQDIMQDAYLKILQSLDSYKQDTNALAWMLMIARNMTINVYNRRKKEILIDVDEQEQLLGASYNDSIQATPLMDQMYQVLKPDEIELVVLHVINELTHKEIAQIKKKPLGTILWQYNQAIKKLKEKVGEEDER